MRKVLGCAVLPLIVAWLPSAAVASGEGVRPKQITLEEELKAIDEAGKVLDFLTPGTIADRIVESEKEKRKTLNEIMKDWDADTNPDPHNGTQESEGPNDAVPEPASGNSPGVSGEVSKPQSQAPVRESNPRGDRIDVRDPIFRGGVREVGRFKDVA